MLDPAGFSGLIGIDEVAESERHRITDFKCDTPSLDRFLTEQAGDLHRDHLGHTSVLFHRDFAGLVGYITLSNDAIPLETSEIGELGLAYETDLNAFPAVKIGRLAVHSNLQGQGIGKRILDLAVGDVIAAPASAARLLITDAVNDERVVSFYRKAGFLESYWAEKNARNHTRRGSQRTTIKMFRDIYAV